MCAQALQQVMEGCGRAFGACVTPRLRALLLTALLHPNRFARETGYHILAALCALCAGEQLLQDLAPEAVPRLQDGLSENWSQVSAFWRVALIRGPALCHAQAPLSPKVTCAVRWSL